MAINKTRMMTVTTPIMVMIRLKGLRPGPTKTCPCAADAAMRLLAPRRNVCHMLLQGYCSKIEGVLQHFASLCIYGILGGLSQLGLMVEERKTMVLYGSKKVSTGYISGHLTHSSDLSGQPGQRRITGNLLATQGY